MAKSRKSHPIKSLVCAVLTDPYATWMQSQEEEYYELKEAWEIEFKPIKFEPYRIEGFHPSVLKPSTKMIMFDFGGMMNSYGGSAIHDMATENARELIKYAKDNPSVLLNVISSFTYDALIKAELEDLGFTEKDVPNMVNRCWNRSLLPDWFVINLGLPLSWKDE